MFTAIRPFGKFIKKSFTSLSLYCFTSSVFAQTVNLVPVTNKVVGIGNSVISVMVALGGIVSTVMLTWVGYKVIFDHAKLTEFVKIIAGGLIIGGASVIVGMYYNTSGTGF